MMDKINGGYKKGQAVMEYLITYGLALFVILIVLAILVAVVLPSLQAPETCQFTQPGFSCSSKKHVLVSDVNNDVKVLFQLDNNQGRGVTVTGFICSTASAANIRKTDINGYMSAHSYTIDQDLSAGQTMTFGAPASGDHFASEVWCVDEGGSQLSLTPGSAFKGSIAVMYSFQDDVPGAPARIAVATVTGNTQAE